MIYYKNQLEIVPVLDVRKYKKDFGDPAKTKKIFAIGRIATNLNTAGKT